MIFIAVAILVFSFALSAGSLYRLREVFHNIGFTDQPGPRKIHFVPTPLGGGVGILLGFCIPIIVGFVGAHLVGSDPSFLPESIAIHLPGIVSTTDRVIPILLGACAIFFIGLVDDRVGLTPLQKLLGQLLVAGGLAASGIRVSVFIPSDAIGAILTVAWTVALMNAFNLLDNANGLSAGVAAVVSAILCLVAIQTGQLFIAALLLALLGGLLGFLLFNFPTASIFMGDAGSMSVGYLMAVITILFTFYSPDLAQTHWPILLPLLVMAVPLFDTGSVIFLRWRAGRPIYEGDTRHLSHRLMAMGMSEQGAVITIWLLTFSTGITATLLYKASPFGCVAIVAQAVSVLALVVVIEATAGGSE